MSRIAGVDIPSKKRVVIALTYIYGIGNTTALKLCKKFKIALHRRVYDLTEEELGSLRNEIEKQMTVEGELRRVVSMNIKAEVEIGSYRGLRHRKRLPVRGQRTRTNARTRKGKAIPIAGKKK